jgi:hypothetical protein
VMVAGTEGELDLAGVDEQFGDEGVPHGWLHGWAC